MMLKAECVDNVKGSWRTISITWADRDSNYIFDFKMCTYDGCDLAKMLIEKCCVDRPDGFLIDIGRLINSSLKNSDNKLYTLKEARKIIMEEAAEGL